MGASVARQFDSTSAYNVIYGTYRTQVGNTTIKNQNSKLINIGVKQGGIEVECGTRENSMRRQERKRERERKEKRTSRKRAPQIQQTERINGMIDIERGGASI